MTIARKLALITWFALGMQCIAQTHFSAQPVYHHHYHTPAIDRLAYEKDCIKAFVQEIRHQNEKVARWLHQKTINLDYYSSADTLNILNIIDNPALTTELKIGIFAEKMEKEKVAQTERADEQNKFFGICAGIIALATLYTAANKYL